VGEVLEDVLQGDHVQRALGHRLSLDRAEEDRDAERGAGEVDDPGAELEPGGVEAGRAHERDEAPVSTAELEDAPRRKPVAEQGAQPMDTALGQVEPRPLVDIREPELVALAVEPVRLAVEVALVVMDFRLLRAESSARYERAAVRAGSVRFGEIAQRRVAAPAGGRRRRNFRGHQVRIVDDGPRHPYGKSCT
jgi:hypothetical protein